MLPEFEIEHSETAKVVDPRVFQLLAEDRGEEAWKLLDSEVRIECMATGSFSERWDSKLRRVLPKLYHVETESIKTNGSNGSVSSGLRRAFVHKPPQDVAPYIKPVDVKTDLV